MALVAARPVPEQRMMAAGKIEWVPASVCEHPVHGGYVQYYLGNDCSGCGPQVYIFGDFTQDMVGTQAMIEGTVHRTATCTIIDVDTAKVCDSFGKPENLFISKNG